MMRVAQPRASLGARIARPPALVVRAARPKVHAGAAQAFRKTPATPHRGVACGAKSGESSFLDGFSGLQQQRPPGKQKPQQQGSAYRGTFALLLLNFALFAADAGLKLPFVGNLYLYHYAPRFWQYLTSAFCHGSWQHLSSNAFFLLTFGRLVEEQEGAFGVWATYCLCALGASIASVLMQPRSVVSLGASGAVFGLFTVAVLSRLSFSPRRLLESLVLGQFVIQQLLQEAHMQSQVWQGGQGAVIAGAQVGHLAHLAGALAGVLLVFLLSRLPGGDA